MSWQTNLEADLDWRFAELAALKIQAARAQSGSVLEQALLRSLCAMLYAHYEGFCKTAIRLYLKEVKSTGVKRGECQDKLTVFSLQKTFREAKSLATEDCWQFYTTSLDQILENVIDYELDQDGEIALVGESNLYPGLL